MQSSTYVLPPAISRHKGRNVQIRHYAMIWGSVWLIDIATGQFLIHLINLFKWPGLADGIFTPLCHENIAACAEA